MRMAAHPGRLTNTTMMAMLYAKALEAIRQAQALSGPRPLLVTIDGPCGSGKSTLAARLAQVLNAPVIAMDDFYVPHAQKTSERLNLPGGNADVERLMQEVLLPWQRGGGFSYRPYSCHEDRLLAPVHVPPAEITLLEGSYCNLPRIRQLANVRLFLSVGQEEQLRRLRARNAVALPMFLEKWIPLEEAYFRAYGLPDGGCTVLACTEAGIGSDDGAAGTNRCV